MFSQNFRSKFDKWAVKFLPKQLLEEDCFYYSDKPLKEIKQEIKELLEKTNPLNFSVNLRGKFISESEFEIKPDWGHILITGKEREESAINGRIFEVENQITRINFAVKPNKFFVIIFLIISERYNI
jgi:hypothetical protein